MQLMCIRISNAKGLIWVASRLTEKQSLSDLYNLIHLEFFFFKDCFLDNLEFT